MRRLPLLPLLSTTPAPASDDADYLFRLGIMERHLMIGGALLDAHQDQFALPHFGRPVLELYEDIADALAEKRIPAFDGALNRLEAAVAARPQAPETQQIFAEAIATLHRARAAQVAGR